MSDSNTLPSVIKFEFDPLQTISPPPQVMVAYWYVTIYFFSLGLGYDEVLNMARIRLAPKLIQLVFKLTQLTTYRPSVNIFSSVS